MARKPYRPTSAKTKKKKFKVGLGKTGGAPIIKTVPKPVPIVSPIKQIPQPSPDIRSLKKLSGSLLAKEIRKLSAGKLLGIYSAATKPGMIVDTEMLTNKLVAEMSRRLRIYRLGSKKEIVAIFRTKET